MKLRSDHTNKTMDYWHTKKSTPLRGFLDLDFDLEVEQLFLCNLLILLFLNLHSSMNSLLQKQLFGKYSIHFLTETGQRICALVIKWCPSHRYSQTTSVAR